MELSKSTMWYVVVMLYTSATAQSIRSVNYKENMVDEDIKLTLYQIAEKYANTTSDQIQKQYNFNQSVMKYLNSTQFLQIAICMDLNQTDMLEFIFSKIKNATVFPIKAIREFLGRVGRIPAAKEFYNHVIINYNKTFVEYCGNYSSLLYTKGYDAFLVQDQAKTVGVTVDELNTFSERLKCADRLVFSAVAYWTGWQQEEASKDLNHCITEVYINMTDLTAAARLKKARNDVKKMNIIDISTKYWNVSATYLKGVGKLARRPPGLTNVLSEVSLNNLEIALNTTINGTKISSVIDLIRKRGEYVEMIRETPLIVTLFAIGVHGIRSTSNLTIFDVILKYSDTSEGFLTSWFHMNSSQLLHMKKYPLGKFLIVNFPEMKVVKLLHIYTYSLVDPDTTVGTMDEIKNKLQNKYLLGIKYMMEKIQIYHMKEIYMIADNSIATVPLGKIISMKNGLNDLGTSSNANGMAGVIAHVALELMNSLTLIELIAISGTSTTLTIKEFSKSLILAAKEMRFRQALAQPVFYMFKSRQMKPDLKSFISFEVGVPVDQVQFSDFKSAFMSIANEDRFHLYNVLVSKVSDGLLIHQLTVKEFMTVSAFPDAVILIEMFSSTIAKVNLTLNEIRNNTQISYGVLLMRCGIKSIERVKLILTNLMDDTKFAEMIVNKPINETLSIVLSEITTMTLLNMLSIHSLNNHTDVFMPFKILKYRCRHYDFGLDSGFDSMRENCFKNSKYLKILNNKLVGQVTLRDFRTIVTGRRDITDVMALNYPLVVSYITIAYEKFQAVANSPLIFAAYNAGISFEQLNSNNIMTTTLLIFRKQAPVTEQIVAKLFNISPEIVLAAKTATLYTMQQLSQVDNIQKMYASSLSIIFQIAGGLKTAQQAIEKDMPGIVYKLSHLKFINLYQLYNLRTLPYIRTLTDMLFTFFGIKDKIIQESFLIQSVDTRSLQRRKISDILYLHSLSTKIFDRDVMQYSPLSLVSFIVGFSTYRMQDLMVNRPIDAGLKINTTAPVKIFIDRNTFGVTLFELKAFIKRYYPGIQPNVTGDEIYASFLGGDLSILSQKFGVDMNKTQWMKIITYVKKDLQFAKIIGSPIRDWPAKYKEVCVSANDSCTFKELFGKFSRTLTREHSRMKIHSKYIPHLEATDLETYRRLLDISITKLLRKNLSQILFDTSSEYRRLEIKLVNNTIIDLLSQTNITGEVALTKSFGSLLATLVSTSLERLQHAKTYAHILNRHFIRDTNNLTLSQVNERFKQDTSSNVFFYSFDDIINFYAYKLNVSQARIKRLKLAKKYRDSKTISDLYRMSGKSMNKRTSVISIGMNFLDISIRQMKLDGVSDKDIRMLSQMTIADFAWIFPQMDYMKSTLSDLQKRVISSTLAPIFVKTLDSLNTTSLGHKSLVEVIKTPSMNDTQQMYGIIYNRTLASLNGKSMVNSDEFRQILTSQPLADYAASTKKSEASLYSLKTNDVITEIYRDISKCDNVTFCEDKDSNSSCQATLHYGYQCRCKSGFKYSSGILCMDINECKGPNNCHTHAHCTNTVGGYTCKCKSGFTGNGTHCDDINECEQNVDLCQTNCINTNGSYRCEPCPESQHGNGTTCYDTCSSLPCPKHATCTDINSGRECRCSPGRFTKMDGHGNGIECALPTKIIEISGLKVNEQYKEEYRNLSARSTVAFIRRVEKALFDYLKTVYTDIAGIQVINLTRGSVNVKFFILFKRGDQDLPKNDEVGTEISMAASNDALKSINAVPSQIETKDKNICLLSVDTCGINGKCVPNADGFTCNCNDGYKDVSGQCLKQETTEDDKLALKVALPIVLIIMLILFIVGVVFLRKKKNSGDSSKTSSYKNEAYAG